MGFERTVGAVGLVEASSENVAISTPVPGLAVKVYVKAGDRAQAGQKLFSLDDRDLLAELESRRAALEVSRQKLAKLEQAPRAEEIPPAEARVCEAEAALADTAVQQKLIESVTDRRAIREEDLQRRRLAAKAAAARLDGDFLSVLEAQKSRYELEDELAQSETSVIVNLVSLYKALGGGW